ncbi:acyl carrier protein [Dactylosporangium roseum]|uniref:Acyl carrier protein n=1 Tax=Dactylosporangium roseum TaxID=47989 RepID=A0ABY5ZEN4_9ACTN|nr:acyl carrier protein [Dactylosporangium roseum]UWZ39418.1 acyl carrier protein [Dactylosporangium roseum]
MTPGPEQIHAVFDRRRRLGQDTNFFEAGFTSALLAETLEDLNALGLPVRLVDLYHHPSVRALAQAFAPPEPPAPHVPPWRR